MTKNLITNLERLFILKEMYLTVIWHRLKELLICSIIMSVIICVLSVSGAMPKSSTLRSIERAIAPILYVIWNIFMLRRCYIALKGNNVYYYSNLSAYLLFMAISLFEYHFISRKLYSWLFIITYIGRFSNLGISTYSSFAIFHSIMFICIFGLFIKGTYSLKCFHNIGCFVVSFLQ